MRNQRLVEQLREKSSQFSKLQVHTNKMEEQLDKFLKQQSFNDKMDKLMLDERIVKVPAVILDKVPFPVDFHRRTHFRWKIVSVNSNRLSEAAELRSTAIARRWAPFLFFSSK